MVHLTPSFINDRSKQAQELIDEAVSQSEYYSFPHTNCTTTLRVPSSWLSAIDCKSKCGLGKMQQNHRTGILMRQAIQNGEGKRGQRWTVIPTVHERSKLW